MLEGEEEVVLGRRERAVRLLGKASLGGNRAEVQVVGEGDAVAGGDGENFVFDVSVKGDVCDRGFLHVLQQSTRVIDSFVSVMAKEERSAFVSDRQDEDERADHVGASIEVCLCVL